MVLPTMASMAVLTLGRQAASAAATVAHVLQDRLLPPLACSAISAGSSVACAVAEQAPVTACSRWENTNGRARLAVSFLRRRA